jgi:eukaryotic-like serine/threonine-protein kinase
MADRASAALSKSTGAPDPLIGRSINERFKVTALIARGGMGKVYRAEQAPLGRHCAIKVLNPNYAGEHDPEFHKRFFLEASIASKLTHPNTVTIFDYGRTEDDIYYMAMEYLEGHTLHRAIREAAFFPEERAAHVARQICRALREAHSLGVIHRDLKPANIFLVVHGDESDFVKVLDFGLVKNVSDTKTEELTQTGLFMGSPKYMAPEQIRGDKVDARTDIYALGVIMYEMITGKVPFDRPNSVNILMAHVNEEVPPIRVMNPNCQLSTEIENTVMRCMAKDPDQRFRSMDEVLAALKRVGGGALTATVSGMGTGEYRSMSTSGGNSVQSLSGSNHALSGNNMAYLSQSQSGPGTMPQGLASESGASVAQNAVPRGSKGVLLASVIGALALVGIIAVVAMKPSQPNANAALTAKSSTAIAPAIPTSGQQAPTLMQGASNSPNGAGIPLVRLRLNSEPDGASVKEDGVEICTSTPCDITYRASDADPTKEHKLMFSKPGYRAEAKAVKVGDSPVGVKLTKVPAAWTPPPAPKEDKGGAPPGYKVDIPY